MKCVECGRVFDLTDEVDADEYNYGHDCEEVRDVSGKFTADQFTATQWASAAEKAKFANALVRFIESGFNRNLFSKSVVYHRLTYMYGHIAEFDVHGFYATWFANDRQRLHWLELAESGGRYGRYDGDPSHTWCDVEKAITNYVQTNDLVAAYQDVVDKQTEAAERAELARLSAKYKEAR